MTLHPIPPHQFDKTLAPNGFFLVVPLETFAYPSDDGIRYHFGAGRCTLEAAITMFEAHRDQCRIEP